ncbi:MAG TPA: hypothetical protein VN903_27545 [Polyangia bacterium]|jgi:hypothetical protein|nr:hypothetical protein [Polyangia bacterium]
MANEDSHPETPEELREHAHATLQDCERRWNAFQKQYTRAVNAHMTRSLNYVKSVLHENSRPSDWVRDGFALWIRCYGTGKDLCEATHRLYAPPHSED